MKTEAYESVYRERGRHTMVLGSKNVKCISNVLSININSKPPALGSEGTILIDTSIYYVKV